MKRRNREISIFSMSALDLFASALGAFILIAVVIFPYFPNTGRSPVVVVAAPEPEPCPPVLPCPPCAPCPVPDPTPPATQFPHLDMVIALDVSGSMSAQIAGLQAEVGQLSRVLDGLTPSLGMGVVAFGDRAWQRPITSFDIRDISSSAGNAAAFRDFVSGLDSNMGVGTGVNPDNAEAFLLALRQAATMSWRAEAETRVIVLITDNPAYVEEVDQAIQEAASFAAAGDGRVSTVFISLSGSEPRTVGFLERVAAAGGGQFIRESGGSLTANLLLALM